jgi:hypothetical protein
MNFDDKADGLSPTAAYPGTGQRIDLKEVMVEASAPLSLKVGYAKADPAAPAGWLVTALVKGKVASTGHPSRVVLVGRGGTSLLGRALVVAAPQPPGDTLIVVSFVEPPSLRT